MIKDDFLRYYSMSSGGRIKKFLICLRTPGLKAVIVYRFGQWILKKNFIIRFLCNPLYWFLNRGVKIKWGIDIPRYAKIDRGFYIGHFGGIMISPELKAGKNLNISHQVTIGLSGRAEKKGVPEIGDNVYVAPGAKVFGKIKIGDNVKIGANAVVHKSIPANSIAVSFPGFKILERND